VCVSVCGGGGLLADNNLVDLVLTNGKQVQRTARISLRWRKVTSFMITPEIGLETLPGGGKLDIYAK
jgi:hypothetical protein